MAGKKYTFKTKPDPHQIVALKKALCHRRFGIFFQQRVGKTKVAIDFCGATLMTNWHNKVLIVCPLSVRSEWLAQLKEHYPFKYTAYLYPRNPVKRQDLLRDTADTDTPIFIIVNYDILHNDLYYLMDWGAHTVIFDESHLIGRYNSSRSKSSAKVAKDSKNVLLLTGTPIPKKWYHIFGQFRAMDNRIFGTSFSRFIREWGIKGGYMGKEIVGCVDYDRLSKVISDHSIRVLRKDVFDEPEVENVIIPVDLSPKAHKAYDTLKKQFIVELSKGDTVTADLAITRVMRLQQLCGGFVTTDDGEVVNISNDKLLMTTDLIRTRLEGDEQVVVFYRYTAEGMALFEACSKLSDKPVGRINGSISEDARKKNRDLFQSGDSEIMLIQIATGAMGISLDRAHINIFYSLDFSLSNYQQARDRVMGRNQKSDVTNYFMAVNKTVDYKVMNTLKNDEDVASLISDNWRWVMEE